jgi:2-phosphosulfolactate phosphatase
MRRVVIDFFPRNARRYGTGWAVVAIDVFRATTTACTAVATGRRRFPVASVPVAYDRAAAFGGLLAGEQGGHPVDGFDLGNSPADLATRTDVHRPLVLLTSSGTALLQAATGADVVYAGCLRNTTAQTERLREWDGHVAVIGAGTRDQIRLEDEMACARVAERLIAAGFTPDLPTRRTVQRWAGAPVEACGTGQSAAYLRRTGQQRDIEFVLSRVNDLDTSYLMTDGELVAEKVR